MGDSNRIFTAGNAYLAVTNIAGTAGAQMQLQGVPLCTADGTATGPVCERVFIAGTVAGGISVTSTQQTVTLNTALLGASATQAIPTGAKGYSIAVLTGTATINGTAGFPAPYTLGDANTLAAGFSVTTAAASSAAVTWNT